MSPATVKDYGQLARGLNETWGSTLAATMSPQDVEEWSVRDDLSASVRRKQIIALKAAFARAARPGPDQVLSVDHMSYVPLPPKDARDRHVLDWHQLDALAAACAPYEGLIYVLGVCGPRLEEAARLDVKDVNRTKRELHVRYSKTEAGRDRFVPISAEDLNHLRTGLGPLFLSPDGEHRLSGHNFRERVWKPAVEKLFDFPLTPHDLRHTCASLAIDAGADPVKLANMLGHANPATTLSIYAKLFRARGNDVADRMSEARTEARAKAALA